MSEQQKPKANWTTLQEGVSVSDKGCLRFGRSMIMPSDLDVILGINADRLHELCQFAKEQNVAVKAQKEKAKYADQLAGALGKISGDRNQIIAALEQLLANTKNQG